MQGGWHEVKQQRPMTDGITNLWCGVWTNHSHSVSSCYEKKLLGESVHPQQLCALTFDCLGIREIQKAKFCWENSYRKCPHKWSMGAEGIQDDPRSGKRSSVHNLWTVAMFLFFFNCGQRSSNSPKIYWDTNQTLHQDWGRKRSACIVCHTVSQGCHTLWSLHYDTVISKPILCLISHLPISFYFLKWKLTSKEEVSIPRTSRT